MLDIGLNICYYYSVQMITVYLVDDNLNLTCKGNINVEIV
jgi:hypothetical protein